MKRMWTKIGIVVFCVVALVYSDSFAKGGGSFSSSGRSSYSSSASRSSSSSSSYGSSVSKSTPSSSYGSSVSKSTPSTSTSSGSYGSSVSKSTVPSSGFSSKSTTTIPKSIVQTKMDKTYSKQESTKAFDTYKSEQSKFKTSPTTSTYKPSTQESTTINVIKTNVHYNNRNDYYSRRNTFYSSYSWTPPVYIHNSYSRFGVYDATMLWFMLDHIHDAQYSAMYYNHRNDPGMQQFRAELERLSEENADLKSKINDLDNETKMLADKGTPVDPAYVPKDAVDVVLAADIAEQEIPINNSHWFLWTCFIVAVCGCLYIFIVRGRIF